MKIKIVVFLISFIFGTIITSPSLTPSFNADGYCNLADGFSKYAETFLASGRYILALFYYLFGTLNISHEVVSILAIILSNVFLSLSVVALFHELSKKGNPMKKILLFLGCLLLYYNPLTLELLLFEESFGMCLGVFLTTLAAICVNKKNYKYRWLVSGLLLLLTACCYQGILCLFVPLSMVLFYKEGIKFKEVFKFLFSCILTYAIVYLTIYLSIKFIPPLFAVEITTKVGAIDFSYNLGKVFESTKNLLITLSTYTDAKFFWLSIGLLLSSFILFTIGKFKQYYKDYIYFILIIIGSILIAIIPCLFMSSNAIYVVCRMCFSIGAIVGFLFILIVKVDSQFSITKYNFLIIFALILNVYNAYNYYRISDLGYERYKRDVIYANQIQEEIEKYESQNKVEIEKIYFHRDVQSDGHYTNDKSLYTINIKMEDWNFQCGLNGLNNEHYTIEAMKEKDYLKYFKGQDYQTFDSKQFVFKKSTLYLLLY